MAIKDTIPRQPHTMFMLFGQDKGTCAKLVEELVPEVPGVWCKPKTTINGDPYLLAGAPHHGVKWLQAAFDRRKLRPKVRPPEEDACSLPTAVPIGMDPPFWRQEFKLLPYQREGVAFAARRYGALFVWPAGSGKSAGALNWALHDVGKDGRGEGAVTLIVGIAPTLVQWTREIDKCTTATALLISENVAVPLPGQAVYTSGEMLLAPPDAETRKKRPVVATPTSAAAIGKRGPGTRVVWKLDAAGTHWRTLVKAEFCHVGADPDAAGNVSAVPPVRGDGLAPGWLLTFSEDEVVTSLPRFMVIGWEMMREYNDMLCDIAMNGGITSLIVDEAQKGAARRRNVAVPREAPDENGKMVEYRKLRNLTASIRALAGHIPRRLITTATPIMDRPRDLWAQWDICEPWQIGSYARAFAVRYCNARPGLYGGIDDSGTSNMEELRERLTSVMHQVSSEVARATLPPRRRMVFYLPPEEQNEAGDFRADYKRAADMGHGADREVKLAEAAAKKRKYITGRVLEVLRTNPNGKVLVFTGRRKDADILGDAIRKVVVQDGLAADVYSVHGDYSQADRQAAVDAYRAAKSAVLVATGDSMGTGVDGMQCTDLQLFAMLPVNPGKAIQAEGRGIRQGQDRPILIEYVVAEGTYDERMCAMLLEKLPSVDAIIKNDEVAGMSQQLAYGGEDPAELVSQLATLVVDNGYGDSEEE